MSSLPTSLRTLLVAVAATATGGCLGESSGSPSLPACDGGELVEFEGDNYCVFSGPIIETGFTCPPELPSAQHSDGLGVCSASDAGDEPVDAVGAAAGAGVCAGDLMVDILLLVDDSSSMCGAQTALSEAFESLQTELASAAGRQLDLRVAATNVDTQCDDVPASQGRFNQSPALQFPPPCQQRVVADCQVDSDCADALASVAAPGGVTEATCRASSSSLCQVNPNGSLNSQCVFRCTDDSQCQVAFGDAAICQKPSQTPLDWGCLIPPDTADCPESLPLFLTNDDLDLFACTATTGVNQEKCFRYEQGLNAVRLALDPNGPNGAQALAFVRPSALLAVVIVSNEDDCSVRDGESIAEDEYETCALTTPSDKLVDPTEVADWLKSQKVSDRGVVAMVVSGDSLATGDARAAERAAYVESKTDAQACFVQSYICEDAATGKADWGQRYQAFASEFGVDGSFTNICEMGQGGALDPLATAITDVLSERCVTSGGL